MRDKHLNSVAELEEVIAEMEAITEFEKKQRNSSSMNGSSQENGFGSDSFHSGTQNRNGDVWVKRLAKGEDQIWLKRDPVVINGGSNCVKFKDSKFRGPPKKLYLKKHQTLDLSRKHNSTSQAENNIKGPRTNPCGAPRHLTEFYGTNSGLSKVTRRSYSDTIGSSRSRIISDSSDNSNYQLRLKSSERSPFCSSEFSDFSPLRNNGKFSWKDTIKFIKFWKQVLLPMFDI